MTESRSRNGRRTLGPRRPGPPDGEPEAGPIGQVRVFAYVLRHDYGFAPNPFHRCCTLACCKPVIRKKARAGDWIVGITPRALGRRLGYAMRVDEVLGYDEYFRDPRFVRKKPRYGPDAGPMETCGDNCYEDLVGGGHRQHPSAHYDHEHDREDPASKKRDLGGRNVLLSRRFSYFGRDAVEIPLSLGFMEAARYHRVNFAPDQVRSIIAFLEGLPRGRRGLPRGWVQKRRRVGGGCR